VTLRQATNSENVYERDRVVYTLATNRPAGAPSFTRRPTVSGATAKQNGERLQRVVARPNPIAPQFKF